MANVEGKMDQRQIIAIVDRAGVPYDNPPTHQIEYHFVRFFHRTANRSLNLGYRSPNGPFIADFVFKGKSLEENQADLKAFLRLFGGAAGNRETPYARLQPPFSKEAWLVQVIQGYWAMGEPDISAI